MHGKQDDICQPAPPFRGFIIHERPLNCIKIYILLIHSVINGYIHPMLEFGFNVSDTCDAQCVLFDRTKPRSVPFLICASEKSDSPFSQPSRIGYSQAGLAKSRTKNKANVSDAFDTMSLSVKLVIHCDTNCILKSSNALRGDPHTCIFKPMTVSPSNEICNKLRQVSNTFQCTNM